MRIRPADPKQALRYRRALMGLASYGIWMLLAIVLLAQGHLRIGVPGVALYYAVILAVELGFLLVIRLGANRRLADPSMTLPQIGASVILAMSFIAVVEPGARGVTLMLFVSGLFFGVFRLQTRHFFGLSALTVALYGLLIAWESPTLTPSELRLEVTQLTVLAALLVWLSLMGGYVARLRANLRQAVHRIEVMAHTDDLTGTENRRSIIDTLRDAMKPEIGTAPKVAICLLDLDRFKRVNDKHGHAAGDEVLKEFVKRIGGRLRREDAAGQHGLEGVLGRFGGEEFLVVLRGADLEGAERAAERIRATVAREPFDTSAGPVPVTVSIGVAAWQSPEPESDLIRRADKALYRAKADGRDQVAVSSSPAVGFEED